MGFIVILRQSLKITMNPEKSFFNNEGAKRFINQAESMTNVACKISMACLTPVS
jgi:hypothetical protein